MTLRRIALVGAVVGAATATLILRAYLRHEAAFTHRRAW